MTDITLKVEDGYFIYGVSAIILHNNNVLMAKNDNYPYYYPIGGRVSFGETSENAVLREVHEETGVDFEIDRLAFIHENFFVGSFMGNKPCHEIRLFYLMKPHNDVENIKCSNVDVNGEKESLHWLPIDKLSEYHLFPEFFKSELRCLKNEVGHFITKGGNTVRVK